MIRRLPVTVLSGFLGGAGRWGLCRVESSRAATDRGHGGSGKGLGLSIRLEDQAGKTGRLNGCGRSLPAGVIEGGMFAFTSLTR